MADIDVVPRSRSRAWLWWVLAIVAIVIIAMWLMNNNEPARVGGLTPLLDGVFAPGVHPDVRRLAA